MLGAQSPVSGLVQNRCLEMQEARDSFFLGEDHYSVEWLNYLLTTPTNLNSFL